MHSNEPNGAKMYSGSEEIIKRLQCTVHNIYVLAETMYCVHCIMYILAEVIK